MPILDLTQVSVAYEGTEQNILTDITLSIEDRESVLILGPSGGGKSTLLMTLAGLIPRIIPATVSGTIHLLHEDAGSKNLAEFSSLVATVLQDPESQLTSLTVEDEVAFALENFNLPADQIRSMVDQILLDAGLDTLRERLVYTLSGGQMQRLAIACALVRKPRLLILDEPLSNLDPVGVNEVMALIRDTVTNQNSSIIMTAHDFSGFADIFSRVVIVNEGRVVRDGPIRTILADVPFLQSLGLEVPPYIERAAHCLARNMTEAPLSLEELNRQVGCQAKIDAEEASPSYVPEVTDAIAVELLNVTVKAGKTNQIIRDASFSIRQGEIVALLGFNGSGKSTLALTIAGAVQPATGQVRIFGERVNYRKRATKSVATKVGYVFQYPEHQFLYQTLAEEVGFGLDPQQKEKVTDELAAIGLTDPARHPYELSGGQKRRLSVKSATIHQPAVLILDEPTYGQDARYRQIIEQDLMALNRGGTTLIIITHDMDLVDRLASRVLVLRSGELVFDGATDALFGQPQVLADLGLTLPWRIQMAADPVNNSVRKEA